MYIIYYINFTYIGIPCKCVRVSNKVFNLIVNFLSFQFQICFHLCFQKQTESISIVYWGVSAFVFFKVNWYLVNPLLTDLFCMQYIASIDFSIRGGIWNFRFHFCLHF